MNLDDDVVQYEESSDDDDEYHNKLTRTIGVTRRTVFVTYEDHKTGEYTRPNLICTGWGLIV
jgi:hypothetical protein